jgi:hypothetical protein
MFLRPVVSPLLIILWFKCDKREQTFCLAKHQSCPAMSDELSSSANRVLVRFSSDSVAKLSLRRLAIRDSVGFLGSSAGAAHDGSAGEHDATAVTFFARNSIGAQASLLILDWDIVQIEGALLEIWLPMAFERLEEFAHLCRARYGSLGAFIEDKNSGAILLQQALRRSWRAQAIDSKLTALGKDERAISVSGYVFQGKVKYTDHASRKVVTYKRRSTNHLMDQVDSFRVGDKESNREDDLLDTFCYGIALLLGNREGFLRCGPILQSDSRSMVAPPTMLEAGSTLATAWWHNAKQIQSPPL